jgi:hypothetical protein
VVGCWLWLGVGGGMLADMQSALASMHLAAYAKRGNNEVSTERSNSLTGVLVGSLPRRRRR